MTVLAERFPVCLIPEQLLVTPVWDDVIHHRCGHDLALRLAEGAQRMLLQEESAGLTPAAVVPTGISTAAQPVVAPFHMILTEHLTLFAETRTSGIAAWTFGFVWHVITFFLEEIEMIHNEFFDLECLKCSYHVHAVYGSGFRGYPGEDTLKDDILSGSKGDEAKAIIERYPDSVVRLTSHFYRCPNCSKLSNRIRAIIYENRGWANDYNLFTEKVICPDCNTKLEEISLDSIFSISCPECKSSLSVKSWGNWD